MNRALVLGLIGAFLGGGLGVLIAMAGEGEGEIFIASNQPITEAQLRGKLQSDGWINVKIKNEGRYFQASGLKDGRLTTITLDAISGRLLDSDED